MRHYAPATIEKALPFITQLASAIDFAKGAGVGHGALHPRDIFVTPDEARATGFGVVDALERMGLRAPVRRPYSPPERIAGRPWNTSADVFSLGVIAFELLTGRRPSGLGDEIGPLNGATLGGRADEVRAVLVRAMHEDPAKRHETALAFSGALANAAGVPEPAFDPAIPAMGVSAKPSADPELRIAPTEPIDVLTELPLKAAPSSAEPSPEVLIQPDADFTVEAAAAPSLTELTAPDAEHALDDFAAEPDQPSLDDSPREVARKVIAARKRQAKKPEKVVEVVADSEAPSVIVPEAAPVAGVLFEEARTEVAAEAQPTVQEFSKESVDATPPAIPTASPGRLGGGRGDSGKSRSGIACTRSGRTRAGAARARRGRRGVPGPRGRCAQVGSRLDPRAREALSRASRSASDTACQRSRFDRPRDSATDVRRSGAGAPAVRDAPAGARPRTGTRHRLRDRLHRGKPRAAPTCV